MLKFYRLPCFNDSKPIITGPEAIIRSNDPNCVINLVDFVGFLFYSNLIILLFY